MFRGRVWNYITWTTNFSRHYELVSAKSSVMKISLCLSILCMLLCQHSVAMAPPNPFSRNPQAGMPAPFPESELHKSNPPAAHHGSGSRRRAPQHEGQLRATNCAVCHKSYPNPSKFGYLMHMVEQRHIIDTHKRRGLNFGKYSSVPKA